VPSAQGTDMITIRYADLPEGLHAQARARGRHTVIYLRPGLSPEQRRQSLRRARQSARMGHGPRLPAAQVAFAVAGYIAMGTLANAAAAARRHPLSSILLLAGLVAMIVWYALFATASIRLIAAPRGITSSDMCLLRQGGMCDRPGAG
jgi:hypothetical protein